MAGGAPYGDLSVGTIAVVGTLALAGTVVGGWLTHRLSSQDLQRAFGAFVIAVGALILVAELI